MIPHKFIKNQFFSSNLLVDLSLMCVKRVLPLKKTAAELWQTKKTLLDITGTGTVTFNQYFQARFRYLIGNLKTSILD